MEQPDLLRYAIETLERLNITYMVVGSIASSAYGEPRLTQDIDIVIDARDAQVRELCAAFSPSDFYVSLEAALQAARRPGAQFNVLDPSSGTKIDFMIARKDDWGSEQVARRQSIELAPDQQGYAARPEDVIISKLLYYQEGGSEKHLRDIAGMLKVSGDEIDRAYVEKWATQLDVIEIWEAILKRIGIR
ncbi:MAG TPA: nucleotidyl transferase AbiEii/AbiGii toxin family protein [Humisphaera sp.]|nr:nucleotidyl transferase AbiEii/AbiGii toxin family protein [Humisphaera sp.]